MVEKLFDHALKTRISQMARKHDPDLVLRLWAQVARIGEAKSFFCKWRWRPEMTIQEALDGLDETCTGLETLLRERRAAEGNKI